MDNFFVKLDLIKKDGGSIITPNLSFNYYFNQFPNSSFILFIFRQSYLNFDNLIKILLMSEFCI
jgi:hypothetical protein